MDKNILELLMEGGSHQNTTSNGQTTDSTKKVDKKLAPSFGRTWCGCCLKAPEHKMSEYEFKVAQGLIDKARPLRNKALKDTIFYNFFSVKAVQNFFFPVIENIDTTGADESVTADNVKKDPFFEFGNGMVGFFRLLKNLVRIYFVMSLLATVQMLLFNNFGGG